MALVAAAQGSCAHTPPAPAEPQATATAYAPLAVGASWTYRARFPGQEGERTVTIIDEKDGYFVDDAKGALRHTAEGLRDRLRYLIRHPIAVGHTWKAVVSASAVERYTIVAVAEPCQTAAGPFSDCLVVEASLRQNARVTLFNRFTWARGVGLVKIVTEAEIDGQRKPQTEQSLLSYRTGGGAPRPNEDDDGAPAWGR